MKAKPKIEQRIQAWRNDLFRRGLSVDDIDELESHLLDLLAEAQSSVDENTALTEALQQLGDPIQAWKLTNRLPRAAIFAIAYVWLIGLLTIANEVFFLGNGRFDLGAVGLGLLVFFCAWKITRRSRLWLRFWTAASWMLLVVLGLFLFSSLYLVVISTDLAAIGYTGFALISMSLTAWQLRIFHKPETQHLF